MSMITVVGSLNMDLVIRTPRFPDAGETISGRDFTTIGGGKGANQAVAIARQGVNAVMVGMLGDDEFGHRILSSMRADHVDTQHLNLVTDSATGVAVIAVDDSGENRIILAPGANHRLVEANIDVARDVIGQSDAVVLQLEVPLATVTHAARMAHKRRVRVILNAAPARELPRELMAAVDYLIVNETEAALLTNHSPSEPDEAARILLSRGPRNVVITLGYEGAYFTDGATAMAVPAFRVDAVDTTAAGDAFVGAFASAITAGKDIQEAVLWGNAAGALAATVHGAQPSLPTQEAVASFLAQRGYTPVGGGGRLSPT